jgi:MraZ protein
MMEKDYTSLEDEIVGLRMFVGEYVHNLDPKKRLTIPSVWRAQIGTPKSVYVLPDFHHHCLNVFPAGEMAHRLEKLRRHSMADRQARQFARVLGEASDLLAWDSQGRIRIKDRLLKFAGLEERVVMVGALDRFELWNPDHREEAGALDQERLEEAARYVGF